ncbi:ABC transporter substrate-binding protein [Sporomusa sp. KB1]|jgi:sulfonate transport system substrate-binding protein|uniref:ABC transporter substrate-binding protein n=1 Tax=Sporomusa sp. KB1 TaxID=943346 RepID=UPI0011AABF70|nr:aliphatic sulfonate ABC transporter substrate-binding protein [Sporomusa sp. KB1]TWH48720.1 aliphatic sulfonates family ABC transporter substrate-binding protein [Sporomusa sp. KB1]
MKKITAALIAIMLAAVTLLGAGCGSAKKEEAKTTAEAPKVIRIGAVPSTSYAPFWVAKDLGYLDEELKKVNYTYKLESFSIGSVVKDAFVSGNLDMGIMGEFAAIVGKANGVDYNIVANVTTNTEGRGLLIRADNPAKSIADLKGQRVAATKSSSHHLVFIDLIREAGMKLDDVQFIHMTDEDGVTALLRGDVAGVCVSDPILTRVAESGDGKIIGYGPGASMWVATGETVKNNPEAVKAVLAACQRADDYMNTHPKESAQIVLKYVKKLKPELAEQILGKYTMITELRPSDVEFMSNTAKEMYDIGVIPNKVDNAEFVITNFTKK